MWTLPINSGYSGAAISQQVAYLFDRQGSKERLQAVDLATGKSKWTASWPATYRSSMDPDSGPRAVPIIANGLVVCYGAAGDLVCIDTTNGKVLWNLALRKQYGADDGYFGAGCSPIVIAGTVVVNIGGKKAGIVGVALKTGKVSWQATTYDASYASPIEVRAGNKPAALVVTRLKTVLVDVQDGRVLSEVDFGARGPTVNAATPLALGGNSFLLTASYEIGMKIVQLKGNDLAITSADQNLLASQYNSPLKIGSTVVGVNGREDRGESTLRLIDSQSGTMLSESPLPGTTHLIAVGNQLLMQSIDGTIQLGSIAEGKLSVQGRYSAPQSSPSVFRALPAFSNHILIVRSSQDGRGGEFSAIRLP